MTPADHMSEAGEACEQRITSGLMNSRVPHIVIGMRSAYRPERKQENDVDKKPVHPKGISILMTPISLLTEFPREPEVNNLELVNAATAAVAHRCRRRRRDFPVQRHVTSGRRSAAAVRVLLVGKGRWRDEDNVLRICA